MLDAQERAYIIQQYRASIEGITEAQLPWSNVREAMIARIERGETLYAYGLSNAVMIYHEQPKIYMQQHFTPEEWAQRNGFAVDGKEGA